MKKSRKIVLLCLVAAIITVMFTGCGTTIEQKEQTNFSGQADKNLIAKMEIGYNGKAISMPFKIGDFESLGFKLVTGNTNEIQVNPGELSSGNVVYKDANGNILVILAKNITDAPTTLNNCTAYIVTSSSENISINGITPKMSKYEDVVDHFGESAMMSGATMSDTQGETQETQNDAESIALPSFMSYSVTVNDEGGNSVLIVMSCSINTDTMIVEDVTISTAN